MSHVLLAGEERKVAALRFLLTKWGLTTGPLPAGTALPTVHDGDAALVVGRDAAVRLARERTRPVAEGGAEGPTVPLICVTGDGGAGGLPAAWLVLDRVDDDGANLRLALRSAVSRARSLRGDPDPLAAGDAAASTYLHVLGHELRSPLTAIKTSLEALEGELGGLGDAPAVGRGTLKMLSIALRNVRRLHRTVEWSQDLLAVRCGIGPVRPRRTAIAELATRLRGLGEVRVAVHLDRSNLLTDPDLVESLVTQLARTLLLACPDRPLTIGLDGDPGVGQLRIAVIAADGADRPAASRTRLVRPADASSQLEELERLAGFMVAPDLVAALDASLHVVADGTGPALALHLATPAPAPAAS